MKIGILGTRGIPNTYGGFEQLTEYLSVGLVERGHEVYVYNSSLHTYKEKNYCGVNIITCYNPENKIGTAGQFIYDLNCIIDAKTRNYDVLLQLGYTSNSMWCFLLPKKTIIITNMDGMEWQRSKYGKFVQRFLMKAEKWAVNSSNILIADSLAIKQYIFEKYNLTASYIAYGAIPFIDPDQPGLKKYFVEKNNYYLAIARFEPENNLEIIIKGYIKSKSTSPLVLIGSTDNKFGQFLKKKYTNKNIKFLGPLYDLKELDNLRFFCNLYFHGHSIGGTNPSLIEAMASQALICAHNNKFNRAILEQDALYFNNEDDVCSIISNPNCPERSIFIENNLNKIKKTFSRINIINQYETLMLKAEKK